jgi:hypothetical protein
MPAQATIPSQTYITIDGDTKIFHNKTKFTCYLSMNPALQRIIKEKQNKTKQQQQKNNNNSARMETMP